MDRTTKILLSVIAAGLWANIAVSIFRPVAALGQSSELSDIASAVSSITLDLSDISAGKCGNKKLC